MAHRLDQRPCCRISRARPPCGDRRYWREQLSAGEKRIHVCPGGRASRSRYQKSSARLAAAIQRSACLCGGGFRFSEKSEENPGYVGISAAIRHPLASTPTCRRDKKEWFSIWHCKTIFEC